MRIHEVSRDQNHETKLNLNFGNGLEILEESGSNWIWCSLVKKMVRVWIWREGKNERKGELWRTEEEALWVGTSLCCEDSMHGRID